MAAAPAGLSFARLNAPRRLAGVDLARGLAVIGMLAAHLLAIDPFDWATPHTWVAVVDGRSSILFALLAGVSIALATGRTDPPRGAALREARRRLARRAGGLWLLGAALILTGVPVYVILPAYAILFLVAIPLLPLRAPALLAASCVGLVVLPFVQAGLGLLPWWSTDAGQLVGLAIGWAYPFPLWAAYLVAGLALGRLDLRETRVVVGMIVAGVGAMLVGYGIGGMFVPVADPRTYLQVVVSALPHSGGLPEAVGSTGFAVTLLGTCLLLARTPVSRVLLPLRATGSMPLTAYTAQLLVWAVWSTLAFGDAGELASFRALAPFWPITIGVVAGATAWALWRGRGPLETLLLRFAARPPR